MTPLEICALLSVYARPGDAIHPLAVGRLTDHELIQPATGRTPSATPLAVDYELTSRGKAMVNALMNLPLPQLEERWTVGPTDCTEPL